ncbi:NUDIX hydrolase [Trueperella pecoris]|uniref:NUDIX domain-containing protein n=1 Tax=Trueperella pecoris TaxID=2733571 RepID=A0A7M1QXA8_9ACTO|nr:NUDIX domain-containing protein [Trueperella pecoris]QOR46486.1 NUDIX domain-containing protein [Trueperella pecoris]
MSVFPEHEWPLDTDGYPHRAAGRCAVFNSRGQLLLILGHDADKPDYRWWFTPGGGLEAGESPAQGAARELAEETGLQVDPSRMVGPVLDRRSTFYFYRQTRKQDELFFILHVNEDEEALIDARAGAQLTELEKEVLDDMRWWDLDELAAVENDGELVFPVGLVDMARGWRHGWNGELIRAIEE